MKIIDSHFHWWPRSVFERFCKRSDYPKAEKNTRGGYNYVGHPGRPSPHGEGHVGSPGLATFHSTKSRGERFPSPGSTRAPLRRASRL